MRKALVLGLIGWMLAAGISTSYAMEREQPLPPAPDNRSAAPFATVGSGVTAGGADGIRIQPDHERR